MPTATYSPEDNKLRLYSLSRLSRELYDRVKAAGFKWAPKQELFVAPMWTPEREDVLIELCGEIGDEDTSLVDRAEGRAERFEDYSDKRGREANREREAVQEIADAIPLGQPILVGHHSERHARKHAERIERGMRKAVKLWETSKYWTERAAGALLHAKYKELPAVRHRRIKGLAADKRKAERSAAESRMFLKAFRAVCPITHAAARRIANDGRLGFSRSYPLAEFPRNPPASQYEGAMCLWSALGDSPEEAIVSPAWARLEAGRAMVRNIRRQRRWIRHYENRIAYERAMLAEAGGIVTDRTGPEVGGACRCWASPGYGRGWSFIKKVNRVSVTVEDNWGNGGENFTRTIPFDKLKAVMPRAEVEAARAAGRLAVIESGLGFYLGGPVESRTEAAERVHREAVAAKGAEDAAFRQLREAAAAGVKVVSAPQLFPTPAALARRVVELADIRPGMTVLEPSAGTGALVRAIPAGAHVVVVELVANLARALEYMAPDVRCGDFLAMNGELGTFDRIVMNPPFDHGADIKHIAHALSKLKSGGRLVAICAAGPRQREQLEPIASEWIDLQAGSFKEQGTNVSAAIVVIDAEPAEGAVGKSEDREPVRNLGYSLFE